MAEPVDWILTATALVAAAVVIVPRSTLQHARIVQVMGFLLLGVVVSLIWLRLGSVDVALAEAALGGGLLGGALVYIAAAPRSHQEPPARLSWLVPVMGAAAGAVLVMVLAAVWLRVEQTMPEWSGPLAAELPDTGVEHGITAVLLAFRAYDTLLESAVLMLAGLAALSLRVECVPMCRISGSAGSFPTFRHTQPGNGPRSRSTAAQNGPPSALSWMVGLTAPVLLLAGLWLLFAGSSDSGGAFQSGAVLAALLILVRVAGFAPQWLAPPRLSSVPGRVMSTALVAGVVVFILAGVLGPMLGEPWLSWDPAWAFAAILTVEVLLAAGIAAGLYSLYLALEDPRPAAQPVAEAGGSR